MWAINHPQLVLIDETFILEWFDAPWTSNQPNWMMILTTVMVIATKKKTQLPPMESKPSTEDILNAILPPREWVEGGKHYIQYVSHQEATRVDVARLREMLDQKLMER